MPRIARGLADNQIYHIIIYTKYADSLFQGMHWISSSYIRYYNKRYNILGPKKEETS
uniref:hypothetical protein n=1 Tax=Aliarcobacter sp. TaxID=2321116 RepID=UPI004048DD73